MIAYLDTSVLIPIVIDEPASDQCRGFWNDADQIVSTRLLFVEASAALARATRLGRIRESMLPARLDRLKELWDGIQLVEIDRPLMENAAAVALRFGLRGYDATHCAAGASVGGETTVLASGDRRLLDTWADLGFNTFDPYGTG